MTLYNACAKTYIHKERARSWQHKITTIIKYCEYQNNKELSVDAHNYCCLLYDYAEVYTETIRIRGGLYKKQSRTLNMLYNRVKQLSIKEGVSVE